MKQKFFKRTRNKKDLFHIELHAVASLLLFSVSAYPNINKYMKELDIIMGIINSSFGIYYLKQLIEASNKKAMLEGKIEDINNNLEIDKIQMTRTLRR